MTPGVVTLALPELTPPQCGAATDGYVRLDDRPLLAVVLAPLPVTPPARSPTRRFRPLVAAPTSGALLAVP